MNHPYPLWHPVYWLATWFHSGLFPKAPGTVGTVAALPFAWLIHRSFGVDGLLIASVICFFVGWWVSAEYVRKTGREDPKEVVIDEVAGIWLLLALFDLIIPDLTITSYVSAFLFFRLFDILKPWPISLADKNIKGGFGIMLDDIMASLMAYLCFYVSVVIALVSLL